MQLEAALDSTGNVVDAHVVGGPVELRSAALQSVLQWHFANDTGASTRQVKITFKLPPDTPGQTNRDGVIGGVIGSVPGGVPAGVIGGIIGGVPGPPPMAGKTLKTLRIQGLSEEAKNQLMSRLPVREGDILADDSFERLTKAVRDFDEHMNVKR